MNNLEHLVKAYFYEGWRGSEHSSWEESVDAFVTNSPGRAASTPAEIDSLLARSPDEGQLSRLLNDWGCDYDPSQGAARWLIAVRRRISDSLADTQSSDDASEGLAP